METKQTQIRLPLETLKIAEKLVRLEPKKMDISKALRYFIYRGMQDFKTKGTAGLEPQAKQSITGYIKFLDMVESTKVEDYQPSVWPTRADQQKQEDYLKALSE